MTDHTAAIIFGTLAALLVVGYTIYRAIQSNRLRRRLEDEAWQRHIGKPIPWQRKPIPTVPEPVHPWKGTGIQSSRGFHGLQGSQGFHGLQTSFDFETLDIPTGATSPQSDQHFSGVTDFGNDFHGGGGDFGGGGASDSWGSNDSCDSGGGSNSGGGGDCGGGSSD